MPIFSTGKKACPHLSLGCANTRIERAPFPVRAAWLILDRENRDPKRFSKSHRLVDETPHLPFQIGRPSADQIAQPADSTLAAYNPHHDPFLKFGIARCIKRRVRETIPDSLRRCVATDLLPIEKTRVNRKTAPQPAGQKR